MPRTSTAKTDVVPQEDPAAVIPISDAVLLARHVEGDPDAFRQLMKTYASPIYGYLTRSGVVGPERDDLFQEIFEKVHRGAQRQLPDGPLRPWLFAIAVNTLRSHFRKSKVRAVVALEAHAGAEAPAAVSSPEQATERQQTMQWMNAEVVKLPLPQREAILLCCVQGLAVKEAARALEVPIDTLKTRLRRARLSLAEAAQRRDDTAHREAP